MCTLGVRPRGSGAVDRRGRRVIHCRIGDVRVRSGVASTGGCSMKGHRLQFAALLVAVASLLAYNAVPAFAVVPDPPTNVIAQGQNTTATVAWTPGAANGT